MQSLADISRFDDLRDASRILLLPGIRRRAKAMKPLLNRLGVDEGVRIMQRIKHIAKNAEKLFGFRFWSYPWSELLIHRHPIHVAQRKERVLFSESLPEDFIIREGGIGERLTARLRPRVSTAKQNVRDTPVFVKPARVRGCRCRNTERITIIAYKDSF